MSCPACGGGINFPADGNGAEVPCPHCSANIVLAADSSAQAQPSFPAKTTPSAPTSATPRVKVRAILRHPTVWLACLAIAALSLFLWRTLVPGRRPVLPQSERDHQPLLPISRSSRTAHGHISIEVHNLVTGWDTVRLGYAYEHQFMEARTHGKLLVWLDVTVTNEKSTTDLHLFPSQFHLLDSQRYSHAYQSSRQEIQAVVPLGLRARGGLLFAIPTNSVPLLLNYDPGLNLVLPIPGLYIPPEKVSLDVSLLPESTEGFQRFTRVFPTAAAVRPRQEALP